ncbi:hypothetical protein HD554DRAFT_1999627, partial [Boletus coccyginus]
ARLSIVCSIVRLAPRGWKVRKMAIVSAAAFIIMCLSKSHAIVHTTHGVSTQMPKSRKQFSNLEVDATSDILLVILPVQPVREGNMLRDQRITVPSVFSSSNLISLISVVHFVVMIIPDTYFQLITIHGQLKEFIICDLLAVVTWTYLLLRRKELDFTRRPTLTSRTVCFTT